MAQPEDTFGNPSFVQSVRTSNGEGIEPIDSLQNLFDLAHSCAVLDTEDSKNIASNISIYPNPVSDIFFVESKSTGNFKVKVFNVTGSIIYTSDFTNTLEINASNFDSGIYFVQISNEFQFYVSKLIKK